MSEAVADTFHRSVEQGLERLRRPWPGLFATGMVGGADISTGVFALLVVQEATGNELLAALAFGIGFLALTLANSELFTENFLVPISTVVAKKAKLRSVARLWSGTVVFNVIGAFTIMWLVIQGFPHLKETAVALGSYPIDKPIGLSTFANAVLAGATITLMTWMERSTDSMPARLLASWAIAFLLAAAPLHHSIVLTAEAFGALHSGAPFGYLDWLGAFSFAALGNALGGIGLVTILRLVQVGGDHIKAEQERPDDVPEGEPRVS